MLPWGKNNMVHMTQSTLRKQDIVNFLKILDGIFIAEIADSGEILYENIPDTLKFNTSEDFLGSLKKDISEKGNQDKTQLVINDLQFTCKKQFLTFHSGQGIYLYQLSKSESDDVNNQYHNNIKDDILTGLIHAFPIGMCIVDANDNVIDINNLLCSLLEISTPVECIGKKLTDVVPLQPSDHDVAVEGIRFKLGSKENGNKILVKRSLKTKLTGKQLFIESFIDITDVERARDIEAKANQAKTDFLAKMSHEIRTPLNGVIGMTDVLLNSHLGQKESEHAQFIKKSANLLLSIINDILDFSKIEAGKMILEEIPFFLREEIRTIIDAFKPLAEKKGLHLFSHIDPELPDKYIGDPFRIRQIFNNLVSNAVKFTEEGKIIITAEKVRDNFGTIIILFTVEDTGIGIPHNKLNEIFRVYSQAGYSYPGRYGGTGLGTTIAKQLVEMMEGEIWVESPASIASSAAYPGTRFSFTIELLGNDRLEKDVDIMSVETPDRLKIMIIDGSKARENTLLKSFRNIGIPVDLKTSEEEALKVLRNQYIKTQRHRIVIIEDTQEFNGMKVAKAIEDRDLARNYIIILTSSNHKPENHAKARRCLIDYYLMKPYDSKNIYHILSENFPNLQLKKELFKTDNLKEDISILLAEDDIIGQKVMKTMFKTIGYNVDIAGTGDEAIEKAKEKQYDIIFMDYVMPVKDGIQATNELRTAGYFMPIIALSGNARQEDKEKAYEAGMDGYLAKPVGIEGIKNLLMKWFRE